MYGTLKEIKEKMEQTDIKDMQGFIRMYQLDSRKGVQKVLKRAQNKIDAYEKEWVRLEKMKHYEYKYQGYEHICGIDEVGRGPLAGPVVTAAVILKKDSQLLYINDSKKLSAKKREQLYDQILLEAEAIAIGLETHRTIDRINILEATYKAMAMAIDALAITPDIILVDALRIPKVKIEQVPIIKGDSKSISIAAASIIAKVTRDRMMVGYDSIYPGYGFASNKGYGSAQHIEALKKIGACAIHRNTFIGNFM